MKTHKYAHTHTHTKEHNAGTEVKLSSSINIQLCFLDSVQLLLQMQQQLLRVATLDVTQLTQQVVIWCP